MSYNYVADGRGISMHRAWGDESAYYPVNRFAQTSVLRDGSHTAVLPAPNFTNAALGGHLDTLDTGYHGWFSDYPDQIKFNKNNRRYSIKFDYTGVNSLIDKQVINIASNPYPYFYGRLNDPLYGAQDFTFSCWIKTTKADGTLLRGAGFGNGPSDPNDPVDSANLGLRISLGPHAIGFDWNNIPLLIFLPSEDNISPYFNRLYDGNWHFLAFVRRGDKLYTYRDNYAANPLTITTYPLYLQVNSLVIGQNYTRFYRPGYEYGPSTPSQPIVYENNNLFEGSLTDIRFYKRGLTPTEISKLASGLDLVSYAPNPLYSATYHYNAVGGISLSGVAKIPYKGSGGLSLSGNYVNLKFKIKQIVATNPVVVSGRVYLNRFNYGNYSPKGGINVVGHQFINVNFRYNPVGAISTTELNKKLSSAIIRGRYTQEVESEVVISGVTDYNYNPVIKLDCNWKTNPIQFFTRNFSWDTGESVKYYYRVLSKCLTGCPPFDTIDSCAVQITQIVEATSISDLCNKLTNRLNFPISKVQKLSKPSHTSVVNSQLSNGTFNDCTTFEDIDICTNPICAEFCLILDATINISVTTDVALMDYFTYVADSSIVTSGYYLANHLYNPMPQNVFEFISSDGLNIRGDTYQNTSGYSAFSFRNYTSIGSCNLSGLSEIKSSGYKYIGGIDSYYTDLWPSSVIEINDEPNLNNWQFKNMFFDYPANSLPQSSGFYAIDQNTSSNPNLGFVLKSFVGGEPYTTKLLFSGFKTIGSFPPTSDSYLVNPLGGNTFGSYSLSDLTKSGKQVNLVDDIENYDVTSVELFSRRSSINSAVVDNKVYLLDGTEIVAEAQNSSLQWAISSPPSNLNFTVYKYEFDVNTPSFDILIQAKSLGGSSNYAIIHYLFARMFYQSKTSQIVRMNGSARVRFNRYRYLPTGKLDVRGNYTSRSVYNYNTVGSVTLDSKISLSRPNYEGIGEMLLNGIALSKTNAIHYIGSGELSVQSNNKIVSSNFTYQFVNGVQLIGNDTIYKNTRKYISRLNIDIDGDIKLGKTIVATGGTLVGGECISISTGYGVHVKGGISLSSASIITSSFLGEFEVVVLGSSSVSDVNYFELTPIETVDSIATADVPDSVLTKCNCGNLPLSLRYSQNLNSKNNKLYNFLVKNNLSMPTKNNLVYSKVTDSWQNNFHFKGESLTYPGIQEEWNIIFDFACTDIVGGAYLGVNFWKWSVNVVQSNEVESFNSKVIVSFAPDDACFYNNDLNFSLTVDTHFNLVAIDPELTISQFVLYDSIGLFKTKDWQNDPDLYIRISQGRLDRTIPTLDLSSILV